MIALSDSSVPQASRPHVSVSLYGLYCQSIVSALFILAPCALIRTIVVRTIVTVHVTETDKTQGSTAMDTTPF